MTQPFLTDTKPLFFLDPVVWSNYAESVWVHKHETKPIWYRVRAFTDGSANVQFGVLSDNLIWSESLPSNITITKYYQDHYGPELPTVKISGSSWSAMTDEELDLMITSVQMAGYIANALKGPVV